MSSAADDVGSGRTKPNPDLFLSALDQLQVPKDAAIVFEDSPNGVKAAKSRRDLRGRCAESSDLLIIH